MILRGAIILLFPSFWGDAQQESTETEQAIEQAAVSE